MSIARSTFALILTALLACANGGVTPAGDEPADGPPSEGADAPGQPDAGDPAAGAGDTDTPGDTTEPSVPVPTDATPLPFEIIAPASGHGLAVDDRRREVIRTQAEWDAWWRALLAHMMPPPEPYPVDFDQRMVIAATMGERTHGGYSISVESVVVASDGTVYATVLEVSPGPTCITTQVLNSPAVAVSLEKRAGEVVFVERKLTLEC